MTHSTEAKEKRVAQLRQIRSAGAGCGLVLFLLALFVGGFGMLQRGLRVATFGPSTADLVILGAPEKHANAMVWIAAFTLMAAVFALSTRSTVRALVQVGLVVAVGLTALWFNCYDSFEAIRPRPANEVELIYLWPRPNARVNVRDAVVAREIEVVEVGDLPTSFDCLVITTRGQRYRSAPCVNVDAATRLLLGRGATRAR